MNPPGFPGEVAVIVPAAGSGTRLGGARKQFRELGGKPVIVQTLLVFERHPEVHHIIVAAPESAVTPLKQEFRRVGISKLERVVAGGNSRQESVAAALAALPPLVDTVLVHDAVRPFVRLSQVTEVIAAAKRAGASSLAIPVSDTVRRVAAGNFGATVSREDLVRMQTPQGFKREFLVQAHERAAEMEDTATDDVGLVQAAGHEVAYVAGSADNVKITTPDDWQRAMEYWPIWERTIYSEQAERVPEGGR